MNIPQSSRTEYSTEWKDGEGLNLTVIVSKHDRSSHYSAGYMYGCHIEWITNGYFQNLESAWSAAVAARQSYLAEMKQAELQRDHAFAASVGVMQTSTGEWVTADEWDELEGAV